MTKNLSNIKRVFIVNEKLIRQSMASLMKIYIINLYIAHLTAVSQCPSLTKCIASRSVSL